ncbi:vomeronasal type-2 receptor 26-like [Hyla sarda]|uniref:vomeronasal type-2 receptor 26-like n=1 Tax=Hyla sarda TaxID=327740 RepID=UPI0024C2B2C6|nr:vomeronasal type-2 receptor 26-like [Hyla sarda]
MSGDVVIGGLFDIHIYYKTEAFNFSSPPHLQARKISMLLEDFYNFLSLVFAVDEINLNPNILPNVTLGYNVYDSYVDLFRTIQGAVRIYSGNTKQYPNYNCDKYGVLAAVIEGMASSFSIQYANIFGIYKYPQLNKYIKKVNFTNPLGQHIFFSDGEISVGYDIYNVIHYPDWTINSQRVGSFDSHAPQGKQIILNTSAIVWENKFTNIPRSVCSDVCQPGTRKSVREGQLVCCYDCLPCPEGQISNKTDVDVCIECPEDKWPNEQKRVCIEKVLAFLSYEDPIGVVLTFIAILFALLSAVILVIFIRNRHTPIVKANNRDLSYLILVSLMLSCLCCLIFIERPERITCFLRQAIFGITFAISVSSLLAKTLIVVIAFNATKPGKNLRKWVGAKVPKYIVFTSSTIQMFICIIWVFVIPPNIYYNKQSEVSRIIVECDKTSAFAFYIILGYLCILASVCFIVAFFARKLPDTFNDAKLITFSMLVFFSVWAFFIPTYLSAKGTSTVAVEVFAILASSSGMLCSIFAPKCYIILVKPQTNRRNFVLKGTL